MYEIFKERIIEKMYEIFETEERAVRNPERTKEKEVFAIFTMLKFSIVIKVQEFISMKISVSYTSTSSLLFVSTHRWIKLKDVNRVFKR